MTERTALVTGVSRRLGIGAAVARALTPAGHRLLLTGLPGSADARWITGQVIDSEGGFHRHG